MLCAVALSSSIKRTRIGFLSSRPVAGPAARWDTQTQPDHLLETRRDRLIKPNFTLRRSTFLNVRSDRCHRAGTLTLVDRHRQDADTTRTAAEIAAGHSRCVVMSPRPTTRRSLVPFQPTQGLNRLIRCHARIRS